MRDLVLCRLVHLTESLTGTSDLENGVPSCSVLGKAFQWV